MKKYYPVPLHMHSVWERFASMEGHFYNAQKLGIKHMYITDHDIRMCRKKYHVDSFNFDRGMYFEEQPSGGRKRFQGFTVEDGAHPSFKAECVKRDGGSSMVLTTQADGTGEWCRGSVIFDTSQKRHEFALLAGVKLEISGDWGAEHADSYTVIDIIMSQRPPHFKYGVIRYVIGDYTPSPEECVKVCPIKAHGRQSLLLDLMHDAEGVGGGDNVLQKIRIEVGAKNKGRAEIAVKHLKITWDLEGEAARLAQAELAAEIGKKYDVTPIVTTEITEAGQHKISFSTKVPIIDYEALNYNVSHLDAVNHVKKYGGTFALNHPMELSSAPGLSDAQKDEAVQRVADEYIQNHLYGAAMMEVGFPEGRGPFTLAHHLKLWDTLSSAGEFITGYGDSDNHANDSSWFDGNNFVTFIGCHTPCEEEFIASMHRGDIYSGDPVHIKGEISLYDKCGASMGQAVRGAAAMDITFKAYGLPHGCVVRIIADGEVCLSEHADGDYAGHIRRELKNKISFVRAECFLGDRCILLTNPIYYINDSSMPIPQERLFAINK